MRLNMTTGLVAGEAKDELSCARLRLQPGTPHKKHKQIRFLRKQGKIEAGEGGEREMRALPLPCLIICRRPPHHQAASQDDGLDATFNAVVVASHRN